MKGFLLVNPHSGDGRADEVAAAAAELGVEAHVLREGDDPAALARAAEADAIGVAGGDGSLAPVAQVALARDLAFVVVPAGTRNHFARDLGLDPRDPLAALAAFDGVERRVDVGRAGKRLFLNNVSLGAYARLVHRREQHRRRREALARARALAHSLADRHDELPLSLDGAPLEARIVLVANNHYDLDVLSLGARERLDTGELHLYLLSGSLLAPGSWQERAGTEFTLESPLETLEAAIDGEPAELETPLRFQVEPRALRVLQPRR